LYKANRYGSFRNAGRVASIYHRADERVLRLIYGMMKADAHEGDFHLTEEHKQILKERLAAHRQDPIAGSSWEGGKKTAYE
jgi:putative addiction module component (TIGR02574 family)